MKDLENKLLKQLEIIEKSLDSCTKSDSPEYFEYIKSKGEWEKRTNGILLRSKAQWIEEGENNTKYFINLEKRNYDRKYIKTLITDNGKEITIQKDIVKEQMNFYVKLYATKHLQQDTGDYIKT